MKSGGPLGSAAAMFGGGLLLLAGAGMYSARADADLGYKLVDVPILAMIVGMVLASIAAITHASRLARASGPATTAGVAMLVGALVTAMPWPFLVVGLFGFVGAATAFGAIIALRAGEPVGALVAIGSVLMAGINTEDERALLSIPIAIVWILVGLLDLRTVPAHDGSTLGVAGPATP